MAATRPLRIGTRGSALALAQAKLVARLLESRLATSSPSRSPAVPAVEVVTIAVAGDDRSVGGEPDGDGAHSGKSGGGDKSRWVSGLERALAAGEIDLAVHSAKDVPGELADGLALLGAPPRGAPEDVLCAGSSLDRLPARARVGTSSVRRVAQLRAVREDLEVVAVRGNVDTRLRKLEDPGEGLDALVLARAGLQRLGRENAAAPLDPARFVPAPGQGTLALEGRVDDEIALAAASAISDELTFACLQAERAVAYALGASCNTPLGAHTVDAGCGCLHLRAWVGLPDGSAWIADELLGGFYDPESLGRRMAERMLSVGADELLRGAEELAVEHA